MNLLMECASNFQKLINYEYHFTLGRKGKQKEITLRFSETDFHHLAGLHKLKDTYIAHANRSSIFRQILNSHITYDTIVKSHFFPEIQNRIDALPYLESFLDESLLIFRYNPKIYPFSSIQSDFLLKMSNDTIPDIVFLFLYHSENGIYFCRSFFPMERTDYAKGQMQYTLLKKEKQATKL